MKRAWLLLALGASACSDAVIDLSLQLPATQPIGFDMSCVTAIEVRADSMARDQFTGAPGFVSQCIDVTPMMKWSDVRARMSGKFDIAMPPEGLAGIEVHGTVGSCADKLPEHESIFYGGTAYRDGESQMAVPVLANISCDKKATYTIRAIDLMATLASHACTKPDLAADLHAADIHPWMLGPGVLPMQFEFGTSVVTPSADGVATVESFSTIVPTGCIAVAYDSASAHVGACINVSAPTLCGAPGELELPVISQDLAFSSMDGALLTQIGQPVFGAVWEQSPSAPSAPTAKLTLAGATVTLEDPSQGKVVYVQKSGGKLVPIDSATATGADGLFMVYLKGPPTALIVRAPGHREERYTVAPPGITAGTLLAALPPT